MPIVSINQKSVHIQEFNKGAAQTVVMIHGMFSNLSIYYYQIAPVLAQQFHVVLYDLKSHGLSERIDTGYDLESMSTDLNNLLQYLEIQKAHLVGYSFGGLIALKTAQRFPELVDRLVIIEAPNPADNETRDIIDQYSKEFLLNYIDNFTETTSVKMGKRQLEKNHRMYEYLFHQTSIKEDMKAEEKFLSNPVATCITQKTLLLYGMYSNCLETGLLLQNKIAESQLISIEGDHNIPIQEPGAIAQSIMKFL